MSDLTFMFRLSLKHASDTEVFSSSFFLVYSDTCFKLLEEKNAGERR